MESKVEKDVISFDFDVLESGEELIIEDDSSLDDDKPFVKEEEKVDDSGNEGELPIKEETVQALGEDFEFEPVQENFSEIAVGILGEDFTILIPEGDEELEVPISQANLTKEDFVELVKTYIGEEKQKLKDNSISIRGLDETTVSIINAVKKSKGSLKEVERLLQLQDDFISPLRNLDLDKEEDQVKAIRMRYGSDSKYEEDMIEAVIYAAKSKGELKETALKSFEELEGVIAKEAERVNKELEEREVRVKESLVNYREEVVSSLVSKWGLKESFAKKISDFAGKQTNGKDSQHAFEIDKRYLETRQDKELALDYLLICLSSVL